MVRYTKTAQHSVHPTGGSLRVCEQFAWLRVGSIKVALHRPTHQRVTQTVGTLLAQQKNNENDECHEKGFSLHYFHRQAIFVQGTAQRLALPAGGRDETTPFCRNQL